ncbi:MAG: aldo/keto reductase [Candidatus Krumholzibacteriota bacterium]|nr:aldo/keto reductase [Candidatus Krumholzibacteriota bacterium]
MEKRTLGKSGLKVTAIGLGCWAIGGLNWRQGVSVGWDGADDEESLRALREAHALGIDHLDTADVYGDGHSERLIGRLLKEVPRDTVVVASKVGWLAGSAGCAYEPVHMCHQLEQTLANLGTDHLDLYYFHNPYFGDGNAWIHEAAEQMHRFKQEGKIRAIGQSAYSFDEFAKVCPVTDPDVLQLRYCYLDTQYDDPEKDLFAWAEARKYGLVLFSPLGQGLLLDKYDPKDPPAFREGDTRRNRRLFSAEGLADLKPRLARIKERFGHSPDSLARVAIQYGLARSRLAVSIPGFKNAEQVRMNAATDGRPLPADDVAFIRETMKGLGA